MEPKDIEITNLELGEFRTGLQVLAQFKFEPTDGAEKKAARQLVASRVGRALRELRNALETFDDRNTELVMLHAKRDAQNIPVRILDDKGQPVGVELRDVREFMEDRKPLLREKVRIPNIVGIDYALLAKADIPVDGEVAGMLGDFISGEPAQWVPPEMQGAQ